MVNKNIIKKFTAAGFFALASFLVLWQMLLPGYILTLDMVFTPKIKIFIGQDLIYNTLPVKYFLQLVNFILPGWVIQKIVLFLLFFLIGWLGYLFIPTAKKLGANYWAGIFLMANPFVYERFLAGHWMHLMAYSFLAPFSFFAIKLSKSPNLKNTFGLAVCLILIGLFSLHFLVMALILALFYYFAVIANFIFKKRYFELKKLISYLALVGFILFLASSYWLIPYFSNLQKMPASNFSEADWSTFKTAGDLQFGTTINILGLYGFWGEYQPWANYFLWPKANLGWLVILAIILLLSGVGIYSNCKNKKFKELSFFLIAGIIGFIFSAGVGDTIFKSFNIFIFDNVWFWSGFRDSQKWTGLLAISYAYFASIGVYRILKYLAGLLKVEPKNLLDI